MEGRPGLLIQACRVLHACGPTYEPPLKLCLAAAHAPNIRDRLTRYVPLLRMRQVLKVWDASGKLLAGPVSLTDFFGKSVTGRFSDAFCESPSKSRKKPHNLT